jgi:hypothetical protein
MVKHSHRLFIVVQAFLVEIKALREVSLVGTHIAPTQIYFAVATTDQRAWH